MDFLNKLGEKAGEVIQTVKESEVTQKAKNYADIPGLSIQVGRQETLIKQTYEAIGEAYYKAHKDDENVEYAEQVATIKTAMEKIGELKAQIEEKKKTNTNVAYDVAPESIRKVCSECGKEVMEDACFCSACGHKFEEIVEEAAEEKKEEQFEVITDAEIIPPTDYNPEITE